MKTLLPTARLVCRNGLAGWGVGRRDWAATSHHLTGRARGCSARKVQLAAGVLQELALRQLEATHRKKWRGASLGRPLQTCSGLVRPVSQGPTGHRACPVFPLRAPPPRSKLHPAPSSGPAASMSLPHPLSTPAPACRIPYGRSTPARSCMTTPSYEGAEHALCGVIGQPPTPRLAATLAGFGGRQTGPREREKESEPQARRSGLADMQCRHPAFAVVLPFAAFQRP